MGLPSNLNIIPCVCEQAKYCSDACKEEHFYYGHKIACPHIIAVKNGSPFGAVSAEKEEQQAGIQELPEISSMTIGDLRTELQSYGMRTTGFLEKTEFQNAAQEARHVGTRTIPSHKTESAAAVAEAERRIKINASFPAVIWLGRGSSRRFRVGQRMQCYTYSQGWVPGTITSLHFRTQEFGPLKAYEMELDDGSYTSALVDTDEVIQRLSGAPVLTDVKPLPMEHLDAIREEFLNGMPRSIAARAYNLNNHTPVVDKYRCSGCGKASIPMLSVCRRCGTAAYCDVTCQREHYKLHKKACKIVAESRAKFKEEHYASDRSQVDPEARRCLRESSVSELRFETLQAFLCTEMGMPYGAAHFLRCTLSRAVAAITTSNSSLKAFAVEFENGFDSIMSELQITSATLMYLLAGVFHFSETAPDLAVWCAAGIDLFFEISRIRPVIPFVEAILTQDQQIESDAFNAQVQAQVQAEDKKKKAEKKKDRGKKKSRGARPRT